MYTRYSKCYRKESMLQVNFNFCVDVYVLRKRGRGREREREREHQREADIDFEIFKIALFKFKDIAMGFFNMVSDGRLNVICFTNINYRGSVFRLIKLVYKCIVE